MKRIDDMTKQGSYAVEVRNVTQDTKWLLCRLCSTHGEAVAGIFKTIGKEWGAGITVHITSTESQYRVMFADKVGVTQHFSDRYNSLSFMTPAQRIESQTIWEYRVRFVTAYIA